MKTVRVFTARYGYRNSNSGDQISSHILRSLLPGREIIVEPDPARANLFAVGSVLDQMVRVEGRRIAVCGTGLIDEDHRSHLSGEDVGVFALRGPLTAVRTRIGGLKVDSAVSFGDLGIFARDLWPELADSPKRYRLGIVPHYVDCDDDELCALAMRHGDQLTVIDPCAPVLDVLRAISECEAVLSSSLHGLVFAESLGVPSQWLRLGDRLAGGSFKFRDWYAALDGYPDVVSMNMAEAHGMSVDELVSHCCLAPEDCVEAMRVRLTGALVRAVEWLDEEPEVRERVAADIQASIKRNIAMLDENAMTPDSPEESP